MRIRRWAFPAVGLVALALVFAVGGTAGTSAPAQTAKKIGLVTDIGGLNDRGFNQLAFQGLKKAQAKLKVQGRVLTSGGPNDYIPNLTSLARQKYDLIIAVGFLMEASVAKVAKQFPNQKFAIIDVDVNGAIKRSKNVLGLLFKEQEVGYIVGVAAAMRAKALGGDTVSSVGGIKIPPVDRFIAGYQAAAKKNGVKVLNGYSQDFVDQAKCKEVALSQIDSGSKVVFQVAGGCGLGALDAAKEKKVCGIGVDNDQRFLGNHVLTSARKKVDEVTYLAIETVASSKPFFKGGRNAIFGLKEGGVDAGAYGCGANAAIKSAVAKAKADIIAGKIKNIPTAVK